MGIRVTGKRATKRLILIRRVYPDNSKKGRRIIEEVVEVDPGVYEKRSRVKD